MSNSTKHILIIILSAFVCVLFAGRGFTVDLDYNIVSTIPSPGPSPQGMAWDGTNIWLSDDSTDTIYNINPLNGFINSSFSSPGSEPRGLTYDGTYLWNIDNNSRKIFKLNPENGSIINFIELPSEVDYANIEGYPFSGLTWDGECLYTCFEAGFSSQIVRINVIEDAVGHFAFTKGFPKGLTFDGKYILNCTDCEGHRLGFVDQYDLNRRRVNSFVTPCYYPTGLTFDGTYLWLADSGTDIIYQIEVIAVGVEESFENPDETPEYFVLHQNYPNPFNPVTTIEFSIPHEDFVLLDIYDVTGQKVTTLVNGFVQSGTHSVRFDASNLASGIYFYRMKTPSLTKAGKMLLVR